MQAWLNGACFREQKALSSPSLPLGNLKGVRSSGQETQTKTQTAISHSISHIKHATRDLPLGNSVFRRGSEASTVRALEKDSESLVSASTSARGGADSLSIRFCNSEPRGRARSGEGPTLHIMEEGPEDCGCGSQTTSVRHSSWYSQCGLAQS